MRKPVTYSLLLLLSALLFFGSYRFINAINEPIPEIHLSIKAFANTTIELRSRADTTAKYTDDPSKTMLYSSQFFSTIILPIDHKEELVRVRLDFDNQSNYIMIEKAWLVSKHGGNRDTIKKWNGRQVDSLIHHYNNIQLETKNESFIQMKCGETDPYFEFSSGLTDVYNQRSSGSVMSNWLTILSALLLTFTGLMLFKSLFVSDLPSLLRRSLLDGKLLIISFFGILFLIFLNNEWGFIPDLPNKENRRLASKPALTTTRFFEYPELYSKYAKDNYSFRSYFFFMNAVIKSKIFRVSPLPDDVILGKKDWFFDCEPNVINDFRKLQPYNGDILYVVSQILAQRQNWLSKRNIKFYVMIPPNKNRVYPELMPDAYKQEEGLGHNFLDLLGMHLKLHSNVRIIDPTEELKVAKNNLDVYYSTDTHWNLYGGFIGYSKLMTEIKKDFPAVQPITEGEFIYSWYFNSEGDLAKMCGLQDVYKRKEYVMAFRDPLKHLKNPEFSSIDIHYSNTNLVDSSHLKLVMFRDSYANYLIPFLNLHFKESNYIWSYEFMDKVIEREQPDVVVFESLQRFMNYALTIPNSERVVENR